MDASRNDRVRALFLRALDRPTPERQAFVVDAAGDDVGLRNEVLDLLRFAPTFDDVPLDETSPEPTDAARLTAAIPERLGDYVFHSMLGQGGMGVVCRAEHASSGRIVALKIFFPGSGPSQMQQRFHHEAVALQRLDHPGIARILDVGDFHLLGESYPYIAMEFIDGMPLQEHLAKTNPTVEDRVELLARLCDIVDHAHACGVVHRDIKPENIRVRPDGRPVLLDFGLARLTQAPPGPEATRVGQLVGTVRYMSPEQARAATESVGPPSDVYSLGVVGFELLTGRMPYDLPPGNVPAAIVAINTLVPRRASQCIEALGGRLDRVLARALEKNPAERHESAGDLARELREAAQSLQLARGAGGFRRRRFARSSLAATGIALAVAVPAVSLLFVLFRPPSLIGQVTAPEGDLEQAAALVAENPATGELLASSSSDRHGRFELRGLPTGAEFVVRARCGQSFAASRQTPLEHGERRSLALTLRALPNGVLGDSLVAWWPAEGDFADVAGGHFGTRDLPIAFTPGPRGQAFSLEGPLPGGIRVPDDRAFQRARAFTIEAWIRPRFTPELATNVLDGIFGKALGCDRNRVTFSLTVFKNVSPARISLWMPDSTGLEIEISGTEASVPQDGSFHHVAATFDGAWARIYLDGERVLERENPNVRSSGLGRPRIGHHPECSSVTVADIDEIRFFARALSGEEIAAIHARDAAAADLSNR